MNDITLSNYGDLLELTTRLREGYESRAATYIDLVTPQLRPNLVLGPYASGGSGQPNENAKYAAAFEQFGGFYKGIAESLGLTTKLAGAVQINFARPRICRLTYQHALPTPGATKHLKVGVPFRWVMTYPDYSFEELKTLASTRQPKDRLTEFVLHYAVLNYIVLRNKPLMRLFDDLRFPIKTEHFEEFGTLPITTIAAPGSSRRAPDPLLAQLCKLSGNNTAEELADIESHNHFPDPLADEYREEAAKFAASTTAVA